MQHLLVHHVVSPDALRVYGSHLGKVPESARNSQHEYFSETSWSTASLLILLHPSKLRYFKLRHEPTISLIVISVIWQKLRSSCWSLGQERITLQIDVSEYSLRLEIFRYSNLWHDFAILHRPLPSTSRVRKLLKPPGRSMHRLRYFRFEY